MTHLRSRPSSEDTAHNHDHSEELLGSKLDVALASVANFRHLITQKSCLS